MMKMRHLIENFDLAREAVAAYDFDSDTLDKAFSWYRISSNAVYPFYQNGRLCFLRLAPEDEKKLIDVQAEIEFIEYLRAHGYPAMKPLRARSGETAFSLVTRWGTYAVSAFEGVAGEPFEDAEMTETALFDYGAALGEMHNLSEAYEPTLKRDSYEETLENVRGMLEKYHAPENVLREWASVREALAFLPKTRANFGLVHYDFEPDNVFYESDKRAFAVIDFDDSMYAWYALDLYQALNELTDYTDDAGKAAFLRGYRARRAFPPEAEETLPLMGRLVRLRGAARIRHCLSDMFDAEPDWMVELRKKLQGSLAEREAGMGD